MEYKEFMFTTLVGSGLFFGFIVAYLSLILEGDVDRSHFCIVGGLVLLFSFNEGFGKTESTLYTTKQYSLLVSTSPSHLKTSGSIEGGFLYFSGYVNQGRFYLLREEVSEGLYKDLEVSGEVYIKESTTLKGKGVYTKEFSCYDLQATYTLLFKTWYSKEEKTCNVTKQVIEVPKGSVVKEINI